MKYLLPLLLAALVTACTTSPTEGTTPTLNDPKAPYTMTFIATPGPFLNLPDTATLTVKINGQTFGTLKAGDSVVVRAYSGRYRVDVTGNGVLKKQYGDTIAMPIQPVINYRGVFHPC